MAIIQLKNGIDRFWRNASNKNALRPEHKATIRSRLLQGSVDEEDTAFALHNALVTAKVVRIDYPTDWPDAFTVIIDLLRRVRDGNQAHLSGALLVLLRVIKELASAKLRRSQTALQAVTPELVLLIGEIYSKLTPMWLDFLTKGRGDEDDADYAMQNSLTCLKALRRLVVMGYEYPHRDSLVQEFWGLSQNQFGQFLGYVSHDSIVPAPYQDVVGKHLLQFTKFHIDMCETHPASFAVLPNSMALVHAYWDLVARFAEVFDKSGGIRQGPSDSGPEAKTKVEGPLLERLALKGLLLLKGCITMVYHPHQTFKFRSKEVKAEQSAAMDFVKDNLLTSDFVLQVVNVIITKLFIFRKSDLEAWEEAPEEWESQEHLAGDAWEWQVRPCSERVFLLLLVHYTDLLVPPLLEYFKTAVNPAADVVTKEAVYTAMGRAADRVYDAFDFDSFLKSTLAADAQVQGPLAKLLRRRIAILLSIWVPIKIANENRPLVFEIFRHLMKKDDPNNDEVVRITAARQLKYIADDFEFVPELFQPYASDLLAQLIDLLQEVDTDDTKLAILSTVRVIINRMDTLVSQFGDQIMSVLPTVWGSVGEDAFMIKQAILSIISTLVTSMRSESQRYHAHILPLVAEAMDPSTQVHTFLLDDAVDMWRCIMAQCCPPLSQELISLEEAVVPHLDYDSKLSEDCLEIVKAYIVLAPEAMLSDRFRRPTLMGLSKILESKRRDIMHLGAKTVQYVLRAAEELGGPNGISVVVQDMMGVGLLPHILEQLHDTWESQQVMGPKAKKRTLGVVAETYYVSILARIAVVNPELFVNMLSSTGDLAQVWRWLSAEWFSCLDNMADVERSKLSCLALTRLTELPQPMQDLVLGKLQDYFAMWTTIVGEVQEGDASGADCLVWSETPSGEFDTPLDTRENILGAKDPIHVEHTFNFIKLRLQDLIQRTGGEQAFEANWAVNVDKDVLSGFQALSTPGDRNIDL